MSQDKQKLMDRNTELRKINQAHMYNLINLLSEFDNWKTLLEVVPKELDSSDSTKRYSVYHIRLIEDHSQLYRKQPAEVFLQEWGIAGKNRPKIGHLLDLLVVAKLWRAADYVAEHILNEPKPKRPLKGPEARVIYPITSTDFAEIEDHLNKMSDPFLSFNSESHGINVNLNDNNEIIAQFMKLIQSITTPTTSRSENATTTSNNAISNQTASTQDQNNTTNTSVDSNQTDVTSLSNDNSQPSINTPSAQQLPDILRLISLVQQSNQVSNKNLEGENIALRNQESNENILPEFSELLNSNRNQSKLHQLTKLISASSSLNKISENRQNDQSPSDKNNQSWNRPLVSDLLLNDQKLSSIDIRPAISNLLSNNQNISSPEMIPVFSDLLPNSQNLSNPQIIPAFLNLLSKSQNLSSPEIIPVFSHLLSNSENIPAILDLLSNSQNFSSSENIPAILDLLSNSQNFSNSEIRPTFSNNDNSPSSEIRPAISNTLSNSLPLFSERLLNKNTANTSNSNALNLTNSPQSPISYIPNISDLFISSNKLPKLELNTELPVFKYSQLELYTNNFNDDQYFQNKNSAGRHLGSGAFGSVYLAVGLMDQNVAVKRINLSGELKSVDQISKFFKNEVEFLSKYQHTNLVSLLGYSCDGPTYCLVYEYVCNGSLASKLSSDSNILSWKERIQIAYGTSVGISYLHTAYKSPLIHRDVKSENILLTDDNIPKVCDFGLIKLTADKTTYFTNFIGGTTAYMAPEAFRGDISVKTDSYSFGVVLFELLTSLAPFDENRDDKDLITYIENKCDEGLDNLVDARAGTWFYNDVDYSKQIYELADLCIEEKKRRPNMVNVRDQLKIFVDQINSSVKY